MEVYLDYYNKYLKGDITKNEVAISMGVSLSHLTTKFDLIYRLMVNESDVVKQSYRPITPKLIKTEEESAKKEFLVSDWQIMTEEEKELYL